jgi:hypothetical protein
MIPAPPIIANAVADATGFRMKSLPIMAEKIALALKGIDYEEVRGDYMGLCFKGRPEGYSFKTE